MSEPVWTRQEIESPCVKICVLHPETKLCTGCARSAEEIAMGSRMTDDQRRAILTERPTREAAPKQRRGGRAARRAR